MREGVYALRISENMSPVLRKKEPPSEQKVYKDGMWTSISIKAFHKRTFLRSGQNDLWNSFNLKNLSFNWRLCNKSKNIYLHIFARSFFHINVLMWNAFSDRLRGDVKKGVVLDGARYLGGARQQLSVKKLPLVVIASIRCRSLQNTIKLFNSCAPWLGVNRGNATPWLA